MGGKIQLLISLLIGFKIQIFISSFLQQSYKFLKTAI